VAAAGCRVVDLEAVAVAEETDPVEGLVARVGPGEGVRALPMVVAMETETLVVGRVEAAKAEAKAEADWVDLEARMRSRHRRFPRTPAG